MAKCGRQWGGKRAGPTVGFTLFEVLTALFLFSLTLLTIFQLSATQSRLLRAAHYYQQAATLADNLQQYLLVHAADDYYLQWQRQVQSALPSAVGTLTSSQIKITWGDFNAANCQTTTTGLSGCLIVNLQERVA